MASIITSTPTSSVLRTGLVQKQPLGVSFQNIAAMTKVGRVRCSIEGKPDVQESRSNLGMGASLIAAISAATLSSPAAMALVDERLSTEGTGLPFGLSNNLLGWILFGVFGFIWALYFVYASSLDEDEDSGLSL
ncbi:unnamed protein product [Trifolium pratense]|uniref:Uncharacterized protein n=1 Tax=Trifolium pratense TaxID=57577 RepID=A0ACB0ILH7_TRIPR|nr:unnamed protein product [Trifolium pratense]